MRDPHDHLQKARRFATLFDSRWNILGVRFGIDPFFDLIPGLTPLISLGLSCYLLYIASLFRVPGDIIVRMIVNSVLDYCIGSIPVIGFVGDIFFRSNLKNLELLEKFVIKHDKTVIHEGQVL